MIKFSKDETEILTRKIQQYFNDELDQEIGQFPARFFLDFVSEEIGAYFYNRGLQDAQIVLESRIESVGESILELQKSTEFSS